MKRPTIPSTDSIQELAQFWDMHEITDFTDQLEVVAEPVFQRETAVLIRLEPQETERVKALAKAKGLQTADLLQEWVREKLRAA